MIAMKPMVLINYKSDNFPEDVTDKLRSLADVVRVSGDYSDQLRDATVLLAAGENVNVTTQSTSTPAHAIASTFATRQTCSATPSQISHGP